jgi:catechol 2,3-dioxygenase-like lactoylglutathione lyase family enzyme
MKLNSISGVTYHVTDLAASIKFYESLGLRLGKQDDSHALCYVNWFWIDLVAVGASVHEDTATSLHIKVDSVDEYYTGIKELGMSPGSEPEKTAAGSREFALKDPDGHRIVFFEKK